MGLGRDMEFWALPNQGDGWVGLQDICHKGPQMLSCVSTPCSAISPCTGFIL